MKLLIPFLTLLLWLPITVFAEDVVINAGLPPFPPFAYPDNPKKNGIVVDIYKMLEKELNIKIDIHYYPYPRVIESMKTGVLDMAIIFKNDSLKSYVSYVGEVSKSKVVVISRPGFQILNYSDLYKLNSIAVLRNASFESRFDADIKIKKFTVVNYVSGFKMMGFSRVDAIVGSQSGLKEANIALKYNAARWNKPFLLNKKEWWVHISNESPYQTLIPRIEKAVRKIYKEDLVWELYKQSQSNSITSH